MNPLIIIVAGTLVLLIAISVLLAIKSTSQSNKEIEDVKKEIAEFKEEIKKLETPTWENPMPFVETVNADEVSVIDEAIVELEKKVEETIPETTTPDVGIGVEEVKETKE